MLERLVGNHFKHCLAMPGMHRLYLRSSPPPRLFFAHLYTSRWGLCFLVWRMTWQEDIQLIKTLNSNSLCASKLTPRYDTKVHWKPCVRLGRVMESLHHCCYDATCVPNHIFLFFLNNYFLFFYVVIIFKK
jgi:hypothetical protein